jgi:hypothetical protein
MAEGRRMTAAQVVDKLLSSEHADVIREAVRFMVAELMEAAQRLSRAWLGYAGR